MESSFIDKVDKARQYAEEHERFHFESLRLRFEGSNHNHVVSYGPTGFTCDCEYFSHHTACSHTMAVERLLGDMLGPKE